MFLPCRVKDRSGKLRIERALTTRSSTCPPLSHNSML
jgi:hypothetical protein